MVERVTGQGLSSSILADNQRTLARLATYQLELSSTKRINVVSDDPVGARQAMRYRAQTLETGKYLDNIDKSTAFMNASDSAMGQMSQVMDSIKALAVQGANGSQDAAGRQSLAQSASSLLGQLVDLGNTVHDGRYIFAGTATGTPPFALSSDGSAVTYAGNLDSFAVQVGPSTSVPVNQNGFSLFMGTTNVFASVIQLRDALTGNDPGRITGLITDLDAAHGQVNNVQGALGGQEQRLQLAQNQLTTTKTNLGDLLSKTEDVDFPAVISQMQLAQTALQAGLQAGAKVMKPTLMDYL